MALNPPYWYLFLVLFCVSVFRFRRKKLIFALQKVILLISECLPLFLSSFLFHFLFSLSLSLFCLIFFLLSFFF